MGMGERGIKQEEGVHAVGKGPLQLLSKSCNEQMFSRIQGETNAYIWKAAMLCVKTKHNKLRKSPELKIFGGYETISGEILYMLVWFLFSSCGSC